MKLAELLELLQPNTFTPTTMYGAGNFEVLVPRRPLRALRRRRALCVGTDPLKLRLRHAQMHSVDVRDLCRALQNLLRVVTVSSRCLWATPAWQAVVTGGPSGSSHGTCGGGTVRTLGGLRCCDSAMRSL